MMTESDVEAIRQFFTRNTPPPRGAHYFADLGRRIAELTETERQRHDSPVPPACKGDYVRRWEQVARYQDELLRFARARTASKEDAEDVVLEAMVRCVTFDNLDGDHVEDFLFAITRRLCADTLRHQQRRSRRFDAAPHTRDVADVPSPEDAVVDRLMLAELLAALPRHQREILVMRASGSSLEDIARQHDMTPSAVAHSLSRARMKMRAVIARTW